MELKSKVLDNLDKAFCVCDLCGVDAQKNQQFIESQIRAAIVEFCEMAEINNLAYIMDHTESENHSSWVDVVKEALAAFGVESKK